MKFKKEKKKCLGLKRSRKKSSIDRDPFFEAKKKRKVNYDDDIDSVEYEEGDKVGQEIEADEFSHETASEKRKRLADETLNQIREAKKWREREEEEQEEDEDDGMKNIANNL